MVMGPSPYYSSIDWCYNEQNIQLTLCLIHWAVCWIYNLACVYFFSRVKENVYANHTASKHLQDWECHHHLLPLWCLEDLMRCHWFPSDHSKLLHHFVVLTMVNPSWRQCFWMGRDRNTDEYAHQISHGCTCIYLEWLLQHRHHHPMVLLGSVLQWRWCHHPMLLWVTGLWWVWCGNKGCGALRVNVLLSCGLDFWHQCWSMSCLVHGVSQDSHHQSWWIQSSSVWCCGICASEVKILHAALELLVIDQSSQDWRINLPLLRRGRFLVLCWDRWGCCSFHSHSHTLHPPVQVQLQKCHWGWSQSNLSVFLLVVAISVVGSHYRRRLFRLNLLHWWEHVVWDLLSRNVVWKLQHSMWNIDMQKANIVRCPWCWLVDE